MSRFAEPSELAKTQCEMAAKVNGSTQKEFGIVERALEQLLNTVQTNRKFTEDIYDRAFSPRPTPCGNGDNSPDTEMTLAQMIDKLTDYVNTTNERLHEITVCLSEQLGNIKLD